MESTFSDGNLMMQETVKVNHSDDSSPVTKYSLLDIEEFLKNNKIPPGIEEYNDMPSNIKVEPSISQLNKLKKPWETEDNIRNLNFLDSLENNNY